MIRAIQRYSRAITRAKDKLVSKRRQFEYAIAHEQGIPPEPVPYVVLSECKVLMYGRQSERAIVQTLYQQLQNELKEAKEQRFDVLQSEQYQVLDRQ